MLETAGREDMRKLIRRLGRHATIVVGAAGIGLAAGAAGAQEQPEIEALRQALSKYQDYQAAVRDLYLSTVGCVYYDGTKMEGHMEYPAGAMGIHFVNLTIQGPPDPLKPNVLMYEPVGGELKLVGAEWLVPIQAATERPTLFGQEFQGPMEGHYPLIHREFAHYDLHVWFKDNPHGVFSPTNPNVSCEEAEFPLLEQGTKMVHDMH
jgi:hypothetical protein